MSDNCSGIDDGDINMKDELKAKQEHNRRLIENAQISIGNRTITQDNSQNLTAQIDILDKKIERLNLKRQNTIANGADPNAIIEEKNACTLLRDTLSRQLEDEETILKYQLENEEIEQLLANIQKNQSILFQLIAFSKKGKGDSRLFSTPVTTESPPKTIIEVISAVKAII